MIVGRWMSRAMVAVVCLLPVSEAFGQAAPASDPGRFELGGSLGWAGGYQLGTTRSQLPPSSGGGTLFEAEASIGGGASVGGHFAWRIWREAALEGAATFSRARLRSSVRSDVEPALNASLDTPFNQLTAEAGLVVALPRAAFAGGRLVPFVTGGGGYLRQLYEDGVLLETGALGFGGGGVRLGFGEPRPDRFLKRVGLRADVRLVLRTGGIDVDDRVRAYMTVAGGAYLRF